MKKQLFSLFCAGLMLTACGQQNKQETTMDFVDNVKVALSDSGHIDLSSLQWTREPAACEIKNDTIRITTAPKTDLWQRTYYHFHNGIVMYLDSENWLKGSVEYENEEFQHLGSVATNNGYSDWATTAIPVDVKTMWYRFSRREDDYCIECSTDGVKFSQMRICHMYAGADEISFGIYACSPEESSFTAVFSDMKMTECAWKAHDGQQPDKD